MRGYRALAFSEAKCVQTIRAFQHFDERWSAFEREDLNGELEATSRPQSSPLPETAVSVEESSRTHRAAAPIPIGSAVSIVPGILHALTSVWPLSTGDLPGAIVAAKQHQLLDPFDPFVMGLLLVAKNDPEQALSHLLPHTGRWGRRTSTILTLLRAAELARLGKDAAARAALEEVSDLPYTFVATACTLLLKEDLDALRDLSDSERFQTIARTAAEHGPLFIGNQFSATGTFQPLTLREWQVLELLRLGVTPKSLAVSLFVSYSTIRTHIRSLRRKLGANSVDEILSRAAEVGLTPRVIRGAPRL